MRTIPTKETQYYKDFREFLTDVARRYPEQTAITTYRRGAQRQDKTFPELANDSFCFAKALFSRHLNRKHIAIVSENSYEWLVAYFGIAISGGVAVCIDIEHSDQTISDMVLQADAEAIVCSDSLLSLCRNIQDTAAEQIQELIVVGPEQEGQTCFSQFITQYTPQAEREFDSYAIPERQTASIVYTSGTTSTAKPVMLSHTAILSNCEPILSRFSDSRERIFNSLPLYHTYGLTCGVLCGLIRGIQVCVSCDLKRMMQEMTLFQPNLLVAVPLIIEAMHKLIGSLLEKSDVKQKANRRNKLASRAGTNPIPWPPPASAKRCREAAWSIWT